MNKFFLFTLMIMTPFLNVFSQEKSVENKKTDEPVTYLIKSKFPVNIQNVYTYVDSSKIIRIFSDSSKQEFQRVLKYYFTLRAPNTTDKDGFTIVEASIDSMEYTFKNKDSTYYYNTQADNLRPPKLNDYLLNLVPLGVEFEMTYSPYQEVAKVGGDVLINKRKYVTDPKTAPSNSDTKFIWNDRYGDVPLLSSFDIVKGILPNEKTSIDSTWKDVITNDIEGATLKDSVLFKLSSFNIKNYIIDGNIESIDFTNKPTRLFDISTLAEVISAKGKGDYKIKVQPRGTITELLINHDIEMKYKIKSDILTQKIITKRIWKIEGMYNW